MSEVIINIPGHVSDSLLSDMHRILRFGLHRNDFTVTSGYVEPEEVQTKGRGLYDHLSGASFVNASMVLHEYIGDGPHGEVKHPEDGYSYFCVDGCRGHVRMTYLEYQQHRLHVHGEGSS